MPFASSPTFGFVYRSTVGHFPQAFLLLIAAVKLCEGIIVGVVNYGMRREEKELKKLEQEREMEKVKQEPEVEKKQEPELEQEKEAETEVEKEKKKLMDDFEKK